MRKIKFRAWDGKKFIKEFLMTEDGEVVEICESHNHSLMPKITLVQYTGLLDKNGKEIYEGDIVKILHGVWSSKSENDKRTLDEYLDSLTKRYEVVFVEDRFMGKRNTGSYNPWSTDNEGNTYNCLTAQKHGYVKIIGNVYENPGLCSVVRGGD